MIKFIDLRFEEHYPMLEIAHVQASTCFQIARYVEIA